MTSVPTTRPPEGFRMWMDPYQMPGPRPYHFKIVEIWMEPWRRYDDTERALIEPNNLHPAYNVGGLWWKPVKSFGEEDN